MDFIPIIISVVVLLISIVLFLKKPKTINGVTIEEYHQLKTELAVNEQKFLSAKLERQEAEQGFLLRINRLEEEKTELIDLLSKEKQQVSKIEEAYKAEQYRLQLQEKFINDTQTKFSKDFELIAVQILKQKTAEFTETNRTNLDVLLNPLKENIKAFEEKVEKVYKSESDERNVLKGELSKLMEFNKQISDEAHNLTKALKGDNKKQGNWGEMVLDKLMEGSGLLEGINYTKQSNYVAADGNRLLPDMVVFLPDQKHIVIDSKVSLIAYEKLVSAESEDDRSTFTKQHIASIKAHITGLSLKNYQDLYQINSPEFVLLFIPIESSFAIAVQYDQDLFDFAWNKKVVIVTPSTLLATLKTVASIWKQEQQTKNAIDIATKAGQLYDKFVGFVSDLQKIGDHLDKSQKVYGDAMSKLTLGSGNLVNRVENLKKLGAKATKEIDSRLLEE
ncbi:DNA recombination protein RmuC [Pedobacter sp. SD-b]|uniref:DNA recombination protein RmuC n=1 Tax=Pedobacter segetis TaxID=2793069 RepID=A0ABS1BJU5_9SPHI|nr:DNA recombination protein RmuC [Pedobacter segetis]MBK0383132.1 DNA recombination protein RmuC [Pedobacter segetis]